jgi:hypothetical protein
MIASAGIFILCEIYVLCAFLRKDDKWFSASIVVAYPRPAMTLRVALAMLPAASKATALKSSVPVRVIVHSKP